MGLEAQLATQQSSHSCRKAIGHYLTSHLPWLVERGEHNADLEVRDESFLARVHVAVCGCDPRLDQRFKATPDVRGTYVHLV
jgi:hypothetical protein